MEQPRVFLSFAGADTETAQAITAFLRLCQYAVVTAADAPAQASADAWIAEQIATCQAFVSLLSPASQDDATVANDLEQALVRRASSPDFIIIPVALAPSISLAFPQLSGFAVVDGTNATPLIVGDRILTALLRSGIQSLRSADEPASRNEGIIQAGGSIQAGDLDVRRSEEVHRGAASPQPESYGAAESTPESEHDEAPPDLDIEPLETSGSEDIRNYRGLDLSGGGLELPDDDTLARAPYQQPSAPAPAQETVAPPSSPPSAPGSIEQLPVGAAAPQSPARVAVFGQPPLDVLKEPEGAPPASKATKEAETALDVAFRAYYPKEVAPRQWEKLLVYIMLDTPQAAAQAQADATERLVRQRDRFRDAETVGNSQLRKGSLVTLVPLVPGFECNPASVTARWEEDAQCHEFRLRAATVAPGQAVNGSVTVLVSGVIMADIPLSIFVQQAGGRIDVLDRYAGQEARRYRKIFASYSHRDGEIVQLCRTAVEATGDRFLQDVDLLRSGQQWSDELMRAISEADIFQLFWSQAAAQSPHVGHEWRYALELQPARPQFIRPVFWSGEPYRIPTELASLHFERLNLAKLGARRSFWQSLFGRA